MVIQCVNATAVVDFVYIALNLCFHTISILIHQLPELAQQSQVPHPTCRDLCNNTILEAIIRVIVKIVA